MDIEEAKQRIVQEIAGGIDGKYNSSILASLLDRHIEMELYNSAIESLEYEYSIRREDKLSGSYWVLTKYGKEKYDLTTKRYVPEIPPAETGVLRVVGTGGQTLGYTRAPKNRDCLIQLFGFIAIIVIVLVVVMS